jgi:hypothetical protein
MSNAQFMRLALRLARRGWRGFTKSDGRRGAGEGRHNHRARLASAGDAKQCCEYYWSEARKSPFKKDDLKMSETGSVSLVEYIVREYQGLQVNQKT